MWNKQEQEWMAESRRNSEEAARMRAMKNSVAAERRERRAAMWAEMAVNSANVRMGN